MRILRARSIVFDPNQEVFLQGRRAFRQRRRSALRWELVNERFSVLDSEPVHGYRWIAVVGWTTISKVENLRVWDHN